MVGSPIAGKSISLIFFWFFGLFFWRSWIGLWTGESLQSFTSKTILSRYIPGPYGWVMALNMFGFELLSKTSESWGPEWLEFARFFECSDQRLEPWNDTWNVEITFSEGITVSPIIF